MEGKKYKGSCGNRRTCQGRWGEPAVGSRLTGASLPPPQLCQYYHQMDSRTHCPPENRSDKCGGRWGPRFSSPGSERFFPQAILFMYSGSQEGEESRFLVLRT
ncbi:unnamed protein product [Rangifer tarandus platyrhynchus]|uniref:Uncharacterized protein n=2 Tax=Rangifer tarandus platyrhynchus TaxID=3082113 RepID=A0ABN8XTS3_RANTA|nr:unnamed protein product [Rangifer tarandus platyrhynchus]